MKKNHEPSCNSTKHLCNLNTASRFLIFFLMLSFASCTAGSCLSYGHSCWGAHGKRSNVGPSAQLHRPAVINVRETGDIIPEVDVDGNAISPWKQQDRWILSRLITGRLAVSPPVLNAEGKRHVYGNRWHDMEKVIPVPGKWNTDDDTTRNEIFRNSNIYDDYNQKTEVNENDENARDFDESLGLSRKLLEAQTDSTGELLFAPSRNVYENRPDLTSKLSLFKILTDSTDEKLK